MAEQSDHLPTSALEDLGEQLFDLTEERKTELDLKRRRLVVDHSLVLHRDSASADDVRAMIAHLEAAGMPGHATLRVDGGRDHTRMWAQWHTEPEGVEVHG